MIVIEQDLIHQEYMTDLMTIIQLRDVLAIMIHLANQGRVDGIKIGSLIDSINPNRAGMMAYSGLESFGGSNILPPVAGTEAQQNDDKKPQANLEGVVNIDGKDFAELREYMPLAVGRVVNAETQIGAVKVKTPFIFRATPIITATKNIETTFEAAKPEEGFFGRIDMMKNEEITPAELLTGDDIIREKFRIRHAELSGYYEEANARAARNRMATLRTGTLSLNTQANCFVISADTARQIELNLGLRFDNPNARAKIFSKVYANTIVVVNERRAVFTFYVEGTSIVTGKQIGRAHV